MGFRFIEDKHILIAIMKRFLGVLERLEIDSGGGDDIGSEGKA